jgi:hypothetical protein
VSSQPRIAPLYPKEGFSDVFGIEPLEMARQLSLADHTLFRSISLRECLSCVSLLFCSSSCFCDDDDDDILVVVVGVGDVIPIVAVIADSVLRVLSAVRRVSLFCSGFETSQCLSLAIRSLSAL